LFYSNGITVLNRNNDTLQNAANFNPGYYTTNYAFYGIPLYYSSVIIPKPGLEASHFIIFHESAEIVTYASVQAAHPLHLSYSEIDLSLDAGLGGIISGLKNIHVINDTLAQGRVSAVKHGNGRDWWILCHRFNSNSYFRILVTPDSIQQMGVQSIGSFNPHYDFFGQSVFSHGGSEYAIQVDDTTVDLYDFDRCTGLLSNSRSISIVDGNAALTGCAISKSGRFLYINNELNIRQYDIQSPNIWSSEQLVASWDTFYAPGPTTFGTMKLGLDGRIYVANVAGNFILQYIQTPDSLGVNCNVIQNTFYVPGLNTYCFPNSPNWDLGPLVGSSCDSLSVGITTGSNENNKLQVYPNPAHDIFWIKYNIPTYPNAELEIYDVSGRLLQKNILDGFSKTLLIHTDGLSNGMYYCLLKLGGCKIQERKIIVIK